MTNTNPVDFYDGSNTATAKKDSLKLDPSLGSDGRKSREHRVAAGSGSLGPAGSALHAVLRQQRHD